MPVTEAILTQILSQLETLTVQQQTLQAKVDALAGGSNASSPNLGPVNSTRGIAIPGSRGESPSVPSALSLSPEVATSPPLDRFTHKVQPGSPTSASEKSREKILYPSRVILTTYPDQTGIKPYPLQWGTDDAQTRGPIICSRLPSSIKLRNAIGAHSGSYSIYRALSIAMGSLSPTHRPNFALTDPPVAIPFQPSWADPKKIVSMDPFGHVVPQAFHSDIESGLDIRPSIAVTKAHIKLSEVDESSRKGEIVIDGKIVLKSPPVLNPDHTPSDADPGVELNVSKAAVEPVWYLPGVAERFGISEGLLRRALFEDTGGMYPELITRPDIKVFLPPIGGLTVYIFGNPAFMSDESKELTLRVHDECNGSDVFGSDICTCKPYLVFAIEECVRCAQRGGVGVVVYFRKEGRALGEVTKYLVYNLRKRGGDSADKYFKSTELIAGVKDMRFQALMPDVLHWLGITKIDNMVSMSDMKYNAIVESGIRILKRYDIPDHLIPPDSRVEIDAKIAAGYFSSGRQVTEADLFKTVGRTWEETDH
ncbi:hypothetical protein SISNIDRAFT_451756 [Sistotremastrum niveocremeum HHB9708]|uniref:Cyclohydrolase n=2 Tax=Sistotremastraceae TaxID=3402574 RepID=A0A164XKL0_9AGAM|nr:hypothetical protein SISNIDRAFT_451756 [Sistotremastrum niveocremeum HHB9708]KZT44593.1 hypothetical protein SISSUDRAFT_1039131 [Sistotremastrum suecicum HHB10207 ss-3]